MATISVLFPQDLQDFIEEQIKLGNAETKAEVVRRAVRHLKEDEEFERLEKSHAQYKRGEVYERNLETLGKKIK